MIKLLIGVYVFLIIVCIIYDLFFHSDKPYLLRSNFKEKIQPLIWASIYFIICLVLLGMSIFLVEVFLRH